MQVARALAVVNRVHQYYGYQSVQGGAHADQADVQHSALSSSGRICILELELKKLPLGSTRFEQLVLETPDWEDSSLQMMQDLFD